MKLIAIAAQLFINGEYRSSCTSNGAYRCDHNLDRTTAHACAPLVPALAGPEARLPPRQNGRSSPPATKVTAAPLQGGGVPGPSQRGPAVVVAVWLNGQSMDKLSGMSPGAGEGRDFGSVAI